MIIARNRQNKKVVRCSGIKLHHDGCFYLDSLTLTKAHEEVFQPSKNPLDNLFASDIVKMELIDNNWDLLSV